jgi:hypothetical protein
VTAIMSPHARVLRQLIDERRQTVLESLVMTLDIRMAGVINGLDEALKLSEEADYKLSGDEPDAGA